MRNTIIFIVFFTFVFMAKSQPGSGDELTQRLKKMKNDTSKVNILNNISWEKAESSPSDALEYANQAAELSGKLNYKKGIADAFWNMGYLMQNKGENDKSLGYFFKALRLHEEAADSTGIGYDLSSIGILFKNQGNFDKAIEFYSKAVNIYKKTGSAKDLAGTYCNIGIVYRKKGQFDKALEFFFSSLDIYKRLNISDGIASNYTNIANAYWDKGILMEALKYFNISLKLRDEEGNKFQKLINIANIGALYIDIARSKTSAGNKKIGNESKMNYNLTLALDHLKSAEKLAHDLDARQILSEIYKNMSESYRLLNKYDKAYNYHILYTNLKDSIFSIDKTKTILGLVEKYESENRRRLDEEKARQLTNEINHRNFLQYLGICIGIFILFFTAFLGRVFIVSNRLYEALIFMSFLLLFQFISLFFDPYIENITSSVPLYKLAINIVIALILTPIEETLEKLVRNRKKQLVV